MSNLIAGEISLPISRDPSFLLWFLVLSIPISLSCNIEMPPNYPEEKSQLTITLLYRDVTEIAFDIHVEDTSRVKVIELTRNNSTVSECIFTGNDTTILDVSLACDSEYHYKAYRLNDGRRVDSSNSLVMSTLDTTNHDFSWEADTLGDGNSSELLDVAIVSDNLAYAVGYLYLKDSTGRWDPNPYNFARWEGSSWSLDRVSVPLHNYDCTLAGYMVPRIQTVFAFGPQSILVGTNAIWNGDSIRYLPCLPIDYVSGEILKTWGTSENNFYAVGQHGTIVHFNGSSWIKMESGTNTDLTDVWGTLDGTEVWACGWIDFMSTVLLRFRNGVWEKTWEESNPFSQRDDTLSGGFTSLWLPNTQRLFILSWYGMYRTSVLTDGQAVRIPYPPFWNGFLRRIRGNASNDLFIVGEYFSVAHFNGLTWKYYDQLYSDFGRMTSSDQRNNMVFCVGYLYDPIHSRAVVLRGRR